MYYPMREADFVEGWMDMEPDLPVPKIDWIDDKMLDIPYGSDEKQRFDLYYPNGAEKKDLPLLIIVHGGGFSQMDKRDWHLYPGFFALREGFAVISMNYRLAPKFRYPNGLNDVKELIRFVKLHAEEYGIDPRNVFLEGTSAGGNLIGITGFEGAKEQADYGVNSLLLFCPAIDFNTYTKDADKPAMNLLYFLMLVLYFNWGKWKKEKTEASITSYIHDHIPPVYLLQGTKDVGVPYRSAVRFYEQLKEATGYSERDLVFKVLEGYGHAGADKGFFQEEHLMPAIEFMKAHLVK